MKAQATAEYAILISLVVAAAVAMQYRVRKSIEARIDDATLFLVNETNDIGGTWHYEGQEGEANRTVSVDNETIEEDYVTDEDQINFWSQEEDSIYTHDSEFSYQ